MINPNSSNAVRAWICLTLAAALSGAACDDEFGPIDWEATPDTALLFSLARPELTGLPAAFDFITLQPVEVEAPGATGNWDVALTEQDQQLVLLPASAIPGLDSRAGIARVSAARLEDVREAPRDTAAFVTAGPVPLDVNAIYVVRTRRRGLTGCVHYAKVQALALDAAIGSFEFAYVRNPNCGDRALVPPNND